ncbi:class I adenylate-forming enzyme family protein [Yinghuangia seranimata]|uniref:class I adenylate-forming enzyme family protein n=1 Tax=Yinghuangia seranimata TaxID=408067 RepID=UPI00248AAF82|nr:class I adenylate-forming enzyme family protein [Yinghuangia seranimata]MDI2125883.1 class I adenylate-forming enzyme family protein [Yinghuangia seranimata]
MRLHPPVRVAEFRAAGWWGVPTWDRLFRDRTAERPDAVALVDPPDKAAHLDAEALRLTWAELDAYVDDLACRLLAHGVGRGTVVGVQLPNSAELAAVYLAVHRLGGAVAPFPVQHREHELGTLGAVAGLSAFVTATRVGKRAAAAAAREVYGDEVTVLAFGPARDLPDGVASLDRGDAVGPDELARHISRFTADPGECVTVCWTSGTEATPKGVPRCPDDWSPMALGSVDEAGLTGDDVLLNPFPMVNMAGIGGMFVPWLMTGATLVQHHPFDAGVFFEQIAKERVTYTVVPPALLSTVLAHPALPEGALGTLRVVGSGSAPLTEAMTVGWADRFGIEVLNFFGSNEGASLVAGPVTVPGHRDRAHYFPRFGSPTHTWRNRASHGMRTRLVDLATGAEVTAPDTPGELRIKGPGVFSGYLPVPGRPDAFAEAFDDDGWFRTGDLFAYAADAAGDPRYLRYVDRAKDIVVRGGMNISAAELEGHLAGHPGVAECAVVGVPDPVLGERACAVVVPAPGADPPDLAGLVGYLREIGIATYKLPERLETVDALPRNPVGKVAKAELRARFAAPAEDDSAPAVPPEEAP